MVVIPPHPGIPSGEGTATTAPRKPTASGFQPSAGNAFLLPPGEGRGEGERGIQNYGGCPGAQLHASHQPGDCQNLCRESCHHRLERNFAAQAWKAKLQMPLPPSPKRGEGRGEGFITSEPLAPSPQLSTPSGERGGSILFVSVLLNWLQKNPAWTWRQVKNLSPNGRGKARRLSGWRLIKCYSGLFRRSLMF